MRTLVPEMKALLRLAIPIAAAQAGTQLMSVVDTAVVGHSGAIPLAAVGVGNAFFFAISIVGMGIVMGVDPLASQAIGGGQPARARTVLWQGVWLSLIVSIVLGTVGAAVPWLSEPMKLEPEVLRGASIYLWIRLLSLPPALLFIVCRAYLQALHITRPMLVAMLAGNVFNLVADLLLVFGGASLPAWSFPFNRIPAMGVAGAAIATVMGSILQTWIIARAIRRIELPNANEVERTPRWSDITHATRVGLPVGLQMGAEYGIFAFVGLLAARISPVDMASHQVAIALASFSFTFAVGIGSAGSVRVGNAVGALDRLSARRSGLSAFIAGTSVMAFWSLLLLIAPRPLARLITNDETVILATLPLLVVAAVFQLSDGVQGVGAGVLRGAGDTRFAFVANIIGHWMIGLPTAWWFGMHLGGGVVGLWWGLCAGLTAVAVMLVGRFLRISSREIRPLEAR